MRLVEDLVARRQNSRAIASRELPLSDLALNYRLAGSGRRAMDDLVRYAVPHGVVDIVDLVLAVLNHRQVA